MTTCDNTRGGGSGRRRAAPCDPATGASGFLIPAVVLSLVATADTVYAIHLRHTEPYPLICHIQDDGSCADNRLDAGPHAATAGALWLGTGLLWLAWRRERRSGSAFLHTR